MHISRIRVPEFRVLKDIDISFEKEFVPRIFPLGSQNGGGKSTLLQLIFVLLHCSTDPERIPYLQNMLQGFKIPEGVDQRLLASFDIWDGNRTVKIEFTSCNDSFFKNSFSSSNTQANNSQSPKFFELIKESNKLKTNELILQDEIKELEIFKDELKNLKFFKTETDKINHLEHLKIRFKIAQHIMSAQSDLSPWGSIEEVYLKKSQEILDARIVRHNQVKQELEFIDEKLQKIWKFLKAQNLIYICSYAVDYKNEEDILLCYVNLVDPTKAEPFLKNLSQKIFLAAPNSQVFLFLSKTSRKLLFISRTNEKNYNSELQLAKTKLSGFFTYDFVAVDLLVQSFKSARDIDFAKAIETNGQYGNSYQTLVNDLHLILGNKKVIPMKELSGVNFKLDNNDNIELYPEDLSHGELKRLSIYIWLKYHNIEDAIVLMDEIEIAFHPDWQYQIISDIQEWAPNNQYILATHSYELCQALTPSHVKEIEPKLLKQNAIN